MRDFLVAAAMLLGAIGGATGILSLFLIRRHLKAHKKTASIVPERQQPVVKDMRNAVERMEDKARDRGPVFPQGRRPVEKQTRGLQPGRKFNGGDSKQDRIDTGHDDAAESKSVGAPSAQEIIARVVQPASQPAARQEPAQKVPLQGAAGHQHPADTLTPQRQQEQAPLKPLPDLTAWEAKQLFLQWIQRETFPANHGVIEQSALQLVDAGELPASGARMLRNSRKVAEFARIGRPAATTAFLFPNPDSFFTPVMPVLFPGLAENWLTNAAAIEPLRIELVEADRWKMYGGR